MKMQILTLAGALAFAAAPPFGQALAQKAGSAGATTSFVTEHPANEWLARVFIGQAVHNAAGEKSVGIPFDALTFNIGKNGERVIVAALSKDALVQAPAFKAIEKTTFDKVKDEASDLSHKGVDKAVDLKDQAAQKIKDMKGEPAKQ